ncbi:MAG TPA: response regulator transcription factor [Candidatus Binataceae bacterium]|nr:response regulator transcription factor [Candidatus Binataceae bacterium]
MGEELKGLRVMIVDDHHIVRAALRLLLEQSGCEVVAEAADAQTALALAPKTRPRVVMMDLEMPGMDGIAATRRLRQAAPNAKVILLSAYDEEKDVVEALTAAGAAGYLLKSDAPDELLSAVRAVSAGGRYMSPSVAPLLLRRISDPAPSPDGEPRLTNRERDVLRLVGHGATSKEIAAQLGISPKTAQVHRDNLKGKLNLRTTADLVRYAIQHKIVKLR